MANRVALGRVIRSGNQYGLFVSRSGVDVVDGSGNLTSDANLIFNSLKSDMAGQLLHWYRTGTINASSTYTQDFSNFDKYCCAVAKEYVTGFLGGEAYTDFNTSSLLNIQVTKLNSTTSRLTITNSLSRAINMAVMIFAVEL